MNRRGFLAALGIGATAGPEVAKDVIIGTSKINSYVPHPKGFNKAGTMDAVPDTDRAKYIKARLDKYFGSEEFSRRYKSFYRERVIDPDIRILRSISPTTAHRMNADKQIRHAEKEETDYLIEEAKRLGIDLSPYERFISWMKD